MKYFKTKHESDSAKITALISLIILLLLFVVGTTYMDPPEEYGVAVNFGTSNFGGGQNPLRKPQPSQPQPAPKTVESQETPQPKSTPSQKENVLTQEQQASIRIKKEKEAAQARAAAQKAKAEQQRIERLKKAQEEKKKKLDALIKGLSNPSNSQASEGDDTTLGDKGQYHGDPYAPSYFGGQGTGNNGVGYGLNGRGRAAYKILKQTCNESGIVVVKIVVNRDGYVTQAQSGVKGTTNTAKCLLDPAEKIARSHKWPADPKAPLRQIGFVVINFKLGQ